MSEALDPAEWVTKAGMLTDDQHQMKDNDDGVVDGEVTNIEAVDVRQRLAMIEISTPLLAELIHMPPHMKIEDVRLNADGRSASVRVSHPNLPVVSDGGEIPALMPVYTYEERPHFQPTLLAADWGPDLGVHRTRL